MNKNFFLKGLIEKNIYVSEIIKRIIGNKYNKQMIMCAKSFSEIDSISSIDLFRKKISEIPSATLNSYHSIKCSYSENTLYGYAYSLLKYAEVDVENNIFYLPLLEHGINTLERLVGQYTHRPFIFQGKYKEEIWKIENNKIPVYYVGPFIHYVDPYYEKGKTEQIKNNNGRTLLVFPPHGTEKNEYDFEFDKFNDMLFEKIGKEFETIIACVYWSNINDPYIRFLESKGVKIVSAGFKLDPLFVSRLKTIIQLSDVVLYPSFTTSIGYSYYLGKQVIFVDDLNEKEDLQEELSDYQKEYNCSLKKINKECAKIFPIEANKKTASKDAFVEKYWGISEIKTKEEIRDILLQNKKYVKKRMGF